MFQCALSCFQPVRCSPPAQAPRQRFSTSYCTCCLYHLSPGKCPRCGCRLLSRQTRMTFHGHKSVCWPPRRSTPQRQRVAVKKRPPRRTGRCGLFPCIPMSEQQKYCLACFSIVHRLHSEWDSKPSWLWIHGGPTASWHHYLISILRGGGGFQPANGPRAPLSTVSPTESTKTASQRIRGA